MPDDENDPFYGAEWNQTDKKWVKGNAALKVQLGGAADLAEADAQAVSLKRAQAARDYLVGKGVDTGRMELQSYGSDWARVETSKGKDEPKNRRVQVWVR